MENTPQIRNATKARIGPWYVLQTRNPAAPGMRFDTLLAFVRKGRIKPRSVVRGPTTHQLWRHAYQVKGLSREFGVCYSCGENIEKTAKVCGRCNRLQEAPANPDALLENEETATGVSPAGSPTVFKDVKPAPFDADIVIPPLRPPGKAAPSAASTVIVPVLSTEAPTPSLLPPANDGASAVDHPSIASSVFAMDEAPETSPENPSESEDGDPMLVASDLAAAFRLNIGSPDGDESHYGSVSDGTGLPVRMPGILARDLPPMYVRRHSGRKIVATVIFLGSLGVALWMILDNSSRDKAVTWFTDSFHAVQRTMNNPVKQNQTEDDATASTDGSGTDVPRAPATGVNEAAIRDPFSVPVPTEAKLPEAVKPTDTFPVDAGVHPLTVPAAIKVPATAVPPKSPDADFPRMVPEEPSAKQASKSPAGEAPDVVSAEPKRDDALSADETADDEPPALHAQRASAMQLFRQANEAMQIKNFSGAARIYEQIEQKFPKGAWPGGVDLKLKLARRSAGE